MRDRERREQERREQDRRDQERREQERREQERREHERREHERFLCETPILHDTSPPDFFYKGIIMWTYKQYLTTFSCFFCNTV